MRELCEDFGRKSGEVALSNSCLGLVWSYADLQEILEEGTSSLARCLQSGLEFFHYRRLTM